MDLRNVFLHTCVTKRDFKCIVKLQLLPISTINLSTNRRCIEITLGIKTHVGYTKCKGLKKKMKTLYTRKRDN